MKINLHHCAATLCAALCLPATAALMPESGASYYLMHSSGNHVADNGEGKAVLEGPDAPAPVMLTFTLGDDNRYTISTPDGTYLSRSGNWNVAFVADASASNAKFTIEDAGNFIKIKCAGNSKFLGTDSATPGSSVFSDKDGNSDYHLWYLSSDPAEQPELESYRYIINPEARRQTFEGWGVSLCWWANMCGKWSDEKIDEIIDLLVSPDKLNFRIFRYNIGGGDDPDHANCDEHHMGKGKGLRAEMEGFKDYSDGEYIWTRDAAQRKIMLKIKEKRPDAIFEAFSNSAPWYMTYSGCCAGADNSSQDNLKPEYYEEFAHYLVDVCKHYKDEYGIEFRTLDPFNEPMTSYWGRNGGQEGCHFDVKSQIEFIKVLAPVLKESGLSTVISAADETSVEQAVKDFIAYRDAGILDMIGQYNTHTYTVNRKSQSRLANLCREYGMPLWMSEVGLGGSGIDGNLKLAQKVIDDIRFIMPSAWIDWQYIEENNDQWCLVRAVDSFEAQNPQIVKNFYLRSQFSRFIKEGYTFLTTLSNRTLAALSPDGTELVLVAINSSEWTYTHEADLTMFASASAPVTAAVTSPDHDMADYSDYTFADGRLTFNLPPKSVTTMVIPVSVSAPTGDLIAAGRRYFICPRNTEEVVLSAADGKVKVDKLNFSDSQIWTLGAAADGAYTFTNAAGAGIASNGDEYALVTTDGDPTAFAVTPLDAPYYKISTVDAAKAFDLEGENYDAGTGVGLWVYDGDAPVHRQWLFAPVPEGFESGIDAVGGAACGQPSTLAVSVPDCGVLVVRSLIDGPQTVSVCNAAGACLYRSALHEGEISLPLAPGYYVVGSDKGAAKAVVVR